MGLLKRWIIVESCIFLVGWWRKYFLFFFILEFNMLFFFRLSNMVLRNFFGIWLCLVILEISIGDLFGFFLRNVRVWSVYLVFLESIFYLIILWIIFLLDVLIKLRIWLCSGELGMVFFIILMFLDIILFWI